MVTFELVLTALSRELFRAITGRLFTDAQIRSITSNAVGRYFADWLPEPMEQRTARERVEDARQHIEKASSIVTGMQAELSAQSTKLDKLLVEIDEKKELANRYAHLASASQEQVAAFRQEIEAVIRSELVAQSEKGKRPRQVASFGIGLVTLVVGAALGAYFKEAVAWATRLLT